MRGLDPKRRLSHGFYRVSDREAGQLAREIGAELPSHGRELRAVIVNGDYMTLIRTPLSPAAAEAYGMKAPKRGWVWAVYHGVRRAPNERGV